MLNNRFHKGFAPCHDWLNHHGPTLTDTYDPCLVHACVLRLPNSLNNCLAGHSLFPL